ncbi:hypothetical protein AYI69_g8632, partial [Smittium culicis]
MMTSAGIPALAANAPPIALALDVRVLISNSSVVPIFLKYSNIGEMSISTP